MNGGSRVFDSSAIVALLQDEAGAARVELAFQDFGFISAVNLAEVLCRLTRHGETPTTALARLRRFEIVGGSLEVVPFDDGAAARVARLYPLTRPAGLSLGDLACLDLAAQLALPAVTGDHRWTEVELGVPIELFR